MAYIGDYKGDYIGACIGDYTCDTSMHLGTIWGS